MGFGARYQVQAGDATWWIADDGVIWVTVVDDPNSHGGARGIAATGRSYTGPAAPFGPVTATQPITVVNLRLTFVGANPHPQIVPEERSSTKVSYFIGHTAASWHPDVPVWAGVTLQGLYPGIDLELTGAGGALQPTVIAGRSPLPQTGIDLGAVRMRVDGATALSVADGALQASTPLGQIALPLLATPSVGAGSDPRWPSVVGNVVSAPFAPADQAPHVVQPGNGLVWSTYLGGSDWDRANGVAVDGAGHAFVAGGTYSWDFPVTPGAFQTTNHGAYDNAFVTELNAAGTGLVYSTYLAAATTTRPTASRWTARATPSSRATRTPRTSP